MATRTVSTKLAIEGESEYRASLSRINSEIKTLQSALKLTESQYQTNANSMAALKAKGEALNNLYKAQENKVKELRAALENAKNAETNYANQKANLIEKIEANNKALEALKDTTGDTSEEQARLTAENKVLNDELSKCDANLAAAEKGVDSWQTQLNNAEIKLNDLDAELKLNDKYLDEAKNSADGCAKSINEFGERTKESKTAVDALAQALGAAGVAMAFKKVVEALNACVQASVDFESAMAGVAKTTDLTETELFEMGEAIKDLSTKIPATAVEIANVTEAAGQLGIAKEDLLAFSEVMVNLGVATNLSSTEAASALAKFANVTKMSASDYERLGSTIVDLGNNFATTEADIVSMATRLASSGAIIGLTEAEIMAVATALSSVGIEAEAGGSSIAKLLKKFEVMVQTASPALEDFASVAGMTAEEFTQAWGENAVQALGKFIDGLGKIDAAGGSAVAVLDDLEITEVRMSNAVLALASSNGILNKALDLANNAWAENTALAKEAATRYETTESKFQLFENAVTNVKIAVGDQLTPALANLAETGADVLNWASEFVQENEWLVPTITAVAAALGVMAAAVTGYTIVTNVAIPAITAFNAALAANPIGAVILGITAAVAAITAFVAFLKDDTIPTVKDLTEAAREVEGAFEESNAAYERTSTAIQGTAAMAEKYIARLKELEAQGLDTNESQEEYRLIVDKLNSILPDLNITLDKQTGIIVGGTDALLAQVDAWKKVALQEALTTKYKAQIDAWAAAELEVYENQIKLNDAITEASILQDRYTAIQEKMTANAEAQTAALENETLTVQEQSIAVWELDAEWNNLWDELMEVQRAINENEKYQKNLNKAIAEGTEVVDENEEAVTEAQRALESFMDAEKETADATDDTSRALLEQRETIEFVKASIEKLAEDYKDAYEAAHSSISGQMGLFNEFAGSISEDANTVEKMMGIWAQQTEALGKYTENLKLAAQYGLDEGLILSLADGSPEAAGYLATIIDKIEELGGSTEGMSTDAAEFVDEFNAAFARTSEAKDSFAETVAKISTDFDNMIASLEQAASDVDFSGFNDALVTAFANVGVDFNSIGKDAGSGLASGISGSSSDVSGAASDMAQGAINATRATLQSHSDSRVMIEIGKDFIGGMITGVKSRQSELENLIQQVFEGIDTDTKRKVEETVRAIVDEFGKLPNETRAKLQEMKNSINSEISPLPGSMQSVGEQMVNGMIAGLNNRSSSLYYTVSSIVNNAIARARQAAATASPSKKTTEIFEDVGEGMVVGLENKREKVADTAQNVVDEALTLDISDKLDRAFRDIDDTMPSVGNTPEKRETVTNHYDIDIHMDGLTVREEADIDKISDSLYKKFRDESRGRGNNTVW